MMQILNPLMYAALTQIYTRYFETKLSHSEHYNDRSVPKQKVQRPSSAHQLQAPSLCSSELP